MFSSKADRDRIIAEYFRLEDAIRASQQNDVAAKESLRKERLACAKVYFGNLSRVPLSRCPFCNVIHARAFDPWGLDGLWWQYDECIVPIPEPDVCPHFRFLQGAVSFGKHPPQGGRSDAIVGPTSPFVIPRILELKGFIAVIAEIVVGETVTGWPIGYFSEQPVNAWDLHQEWTKPTFSFKLPNKERVFWKIADDPWDFDLRKWLELGVLQWIAPLDSEWKLIQGLDCPYVGLPSANGIQIVKGDSVTLMSLPKGSGVSPFEV